jgi:hypothetical protein
MTFDQFSFGGQCIHRPVMVNSPQRRRERRAYTEGLRASSAFSAPLRRQRLSLPITSICKPAFLSLNN